MRHWFLLASLVALLPARARADNYPYVQDGPVITGVTSSDAWVSWYTAHHEGSGTECTLEALVSSGNTDTPTLSLNTGASFADTSCDRYHRVHVTGLAPGARYTFTLDKPWDQKGGTTAAGSFTTAPPPGTGGAVKFVVYGDTRNDVALGGTDTRPNHQAVVDAISANESDAAFLVHTGDLALNILAVSGDDKGYTEFFAVERSLLASKPVFVVLGNHETIDTTFFDKMFDPARYDGSAHPYYSSFDWGRVHLALGDTFEGSATTLGANNAGISAAQVQWLDADLQAARVAAQATFLAVHQGPYSHPVSGQGHGGLADAVTDYVPLMIRYGVLASLGGHDHYYQRGHEGCIDYLVVGGGGAPMYAPDASAAGVAVALQTISYMVVTVQADGSAAMVVKGVNGAQLDSFTFTGPDPVCSGSGPDAGTVADAGTNNDAGIGADAGTVADAGTDAGTGNDAGTDAGVDGGPTFIDGGGCSCNSGNGLAFEGLAALLALGARRRRRV